MAPAQMLLERDRRRQGSGGGSGCGGLCRRRGGAHFDHANRDLDLRGGGLEVRRLGVCG